MIIKTKIKFREYLQLMYRLAYRKTLMIGLVSFDTIMIAWVVCYYAGMDILPKPEYPQYMAIFLITIAQPIGIYLGIRQNYRSSARLHETVDIDFSDDKLKITGKSFYSEYSWDKTFRLLELNDWFLVYQNTFAATIIPKRLMDKKEIEDFKVFVATLPHIKLKLKKVEK